MTKNNSSQVASTSKSGPTKKSTRKPIASTQVLKNAAQQVVQDSKTTKLQAIPSSSNVFEVLSDHDDMDEVLLVPPIKHEKPSPIVIKSKNVAFVQDMLKLIIPSGKFSIKILSIGLKLECSTMPDFVKIKSKLLEEGLEFFFYHTPSTKPRKFVLKGLPLLSIQEVTKLLSEQNLCPDQIRQLQLKNTERCHYILYFKPNTIKMSDLKQIRCLGYLRVSWDHFHSRRPDNVLQCRKCQLFGHNSINCSMKPKCLLCAQDHSTELCPSRIPRTELKQLLDQNGSVDRSIVKCSNCSAAGLKSDHTANWKGCPKRLEFQEIQRRIVTKNPTNKAPRYSFMPEEFPTLPSHSSIPLLPQLLPSTSAHPSSGELFSMNELMIIWKDLFQVLKNCRTKEDQLMGLGNMIIKYIYSSQ